MFILYLLQYLDKTSLGYTAIMGIIEDTVRTHGNCPIPLMVAASRWNPVLLDLQLFLCWLPRG